MPDQRQRLTEAERRAIAEGIELGLTSAEIAERIGRPAGTVRMHRTRIRRAVAVRAPAQDPSDDHRVRGCLCCGTPFWSTGPGNRMCGACGKQTESPFDADCAVHGDGP